MAIVELNFESIVQFNPDETHIDLSQFKTFYYENYKEIVNIYTPVHDKGIIECAKVYCELLNGIWVEDKLGPFRGEVFAYVFRKYLLCFSNPYRLQEYCACHNPYSDHNQTEEEFRNEFIRELYNERCLNDNESLVNIFMNHVLEENKKLKP